MIRVSRRRRSIHRSRWQRSMHRCHCHRLAPSMKVDCLAIDSRPMGCDASPLCPCAPTAAPVYRSAYTALSDPCLSLASPRTLGQSLSFRYLAMPANSAAIERLFNQLKLTATPARGDLPDTQCCCLWKPSDGNICCRALELDIGNRCRDLIRRGGRRWAESQVVGGTSGLNPQRSCAQCELSARAAASREMRADTTTAVQRAQQHHS